jgi:chromosome segregation ATPase
MGALLVVTTVASYEYFRQIHRAHQEYTKARNYVADIVQSFDRELQRESKKFDGMVSRVEGSRTKADASYRRVESLEKKIEPLEEHIGALNQSYQALSQAITDNQTETTQNSTTTLSGLTGLETKLRDIEATQEELKNRITAFEDKIQKLTLAPPQEATPEAFMPPIVIKRDKAMAALTDTEIAVLEMLSKEGAKTAPEIKERVKLSREHTARLMKKLYEGGYLEREAGKIPFRYTIKKEMEALLQKTDNPTP